MGKTYLALWIAEDHAYLRQTWKPASIVVFFPNLMLLDQTLDDWTRNAKMDFKPP